MKSPFGEYTLVYAYWACRIARAIFFIGIGVGLGYLTKYIFGT